MKIYTKTQGRVLDGDGLEPAKGTRLVSIDEAREVLLDMLVTAALADEDDEVYVRNEIHRLLS